MNVRRGMFRLWLLASIAWAALIVWDSWGSISDPYISTKEYIYDALTGTTSALSSDRALEMASELFTNYTEVSFPNRVTLYVHNNLDKVAAKPDLQIFLDTVAKPREAEITAARWQMIWWVGRQVFIPILGSFVFGLAIFWIAAGFRSRQA